MIKVFLTSFLLALIIFVRAEEEGHLENIKNYLYHNDSLLLVAVYKKSWVPPKDPKKPKGVILSSARIVQVFRGKVGVGKKITFKGLIEDIPNWWKSPFVKNEEAELYYLFCDSDSMQIENGEYKTAVGSHWAISYNDKQIAGKLREIIKSGLKDSQIQKRGVAH